MLLRSREQQQLLVGGIKDRCCVPVSTVQPTVTLRFLSTQVGWTPLHRAAHFRHVDVWMALLEKGAAIDAKTNVRESARAFRHGSPAGARIIRCICAGRHLCATSVRAVFRGHCFG